MDWLKSIIIAAVVWLKGFLDGKAAEQKRQQEARDALLQKFDEIGDDGRSLDDALDRMRRNQGKRDVPEP